MMARMSVQSKVIVYFNEWAKALKSALLVAGRAPFDVIQIRFTDCVTVCAVSDRATFIAEVSTEMVDVVAGRDEVVEISVAEAKTLSKLRIRPGDDDVAMAGLIVDELFVQLTDESGLGLGVRHMRVRRESTVVLGDLSASIERARDLPRNPAGKLHPDQLVLLGKISGVMNSRMRPPWIADNSDSQVSRMIADHDMWCLSMTVLPEAEGKKASEDCANEDDDSSAQSALLEDGAPASFERALASVPSVVFSNVPQGIA